MKCALMPPPKYHDRVNPVSFAGLSTPERVSTLRRALTLLVVALVDQEEEEGEEWMIINLIDLLVQLKV